MIRCEIRNCGRSAAFIPVLSIPGRSAAGDEGLGRLYGATAVCPAHMAAARREDYVTDQVYEALQVMAERMGLELADRSQVGLEWRSIFGPGQDIARQRYKIAQRQGLA